MENNMRMRRTLADSESISLLKSSPNILENFPYDEFNSMPTSDQLKRMTSPPLPKKRSRSPKFCETLQRHAFMRNAIEPMMMKSKQPVNYEARYSSPSEKQATVRRSLEEISKGLKDIDDFLTATENVMQKEREKERELELELKRVNGKRTRAAAAVIGGPNPTPTAALNSPNKENKTPSPIKLRRNSGHSFNYKINSYKNRRNKPLSPRLLGSRLYFRNGRIGCVEAERQASNIESTHALVKHILKFENEKPLVSPESVRRVLSASAASRRSSQWSLKSQQEQIQLPGAVDPFVSEHEPAIALKPVDTIAAATGRVLLNEIEDTATTEDLTCDSSSQPIGDEDEQDVQICYDELPELPNEEINRKNSIMQSEIAVMNGEVLELDDEVLENVNEDANDEREMPSHENMQHMSSAGSLDSAGQQFLRDQVRHLVRRFTARANKVKSHLELPPTPSSSASSPSPPPTQPSSAKTPNHLQNPGGPNAPKIIKAKTLVQSPKRPGLFEADTPRSNDWLCASLCGSNNDEKTLDPQGKIYISWLCVVSLSFLYNAWVIPLRSAFPFQTKENTNAWLICDFCADIIYLLDVVFFKHRLMYLFEGFWVKNKNLTRKNYMRKLQFKLDLLALLPLELLYFKFGTGAVYLRFPRLFKIQSFWEVFKLLDRVISSPHFVRVAKTLTYMLYMIHLTATLYYAYSSLQGLGTNRWVFSGKGHPYVRCFAFATKTATSIGKNPKPENEGEYMFMTVAWLMGVFVFALLIGQIRDIISTATRNKNEYRQLEDETLEYMRRLNLPKDVQKRVKMWFKFTWDQQRTLDEANILDALPINLKTDIAISVHIQTLSKVQLFADCEEALLRDLVLKLRAVTFLPGDYVCRKGEVGREMYIIKLGQVQVMGGPNSDVTLATLSEGSVFGEISLLGINGADRRTADVRSKGYSNLFVLSKSDLNEVIAYYPTAQAILRKRARTLMRKNAAREREEARAKSALKADVVIGNPKTPEAQPKLLQTVIQALPYESPAVILITRGSKRLRRQRLSMQMETIEDKEVEDIEQQAKAKPFNNVGRSSMIIKERASPDLLSSIQNELKSKHKCINLTDSEKALIISANVGGEHKDKDEEEVEMICRNSKSE